MRQAIDPAVRRFRTLLLCMVAVLLVWLVLEVMTYAGRLSLLPTGVKAPFVIYARHQSWGIGSPGDAETGLIEYRLARGEAARIARLDAKALAEQTGIAWAPTPVRPDAVGYDTTFLTDGTGGQYPEGHRPSIYDFLSYYGFPIGIGDDRAARIDDALNNPGSYIGHDDRDRLVILSPRIDRVIMAYH